MSHLQIYGNDESAQSSREVVITGVGMVSPIGIGREDYWTSLLEGRSGVGPISLFDSRSWNVHFAGEVHGFEPKKFVRPRKSLKVMSREIQFGFTAADLAFVDAGLKDQTVDSDRFGVVYGADMMYCDLQEMADAYKSCLDNGEFEFSNWGSKALAKMYPLWMLKYLPNMPACHIAIALDARGPNNSITLGEVSSLLAISEATRVIERGQADLMLAGGTSTRLHAMNIVSQGDPQMSHRQDDPQGACRPFDAGRDGLVTGEGAGAIVLESRASAESRGANILARVIGHGNAFEPRANENVPLTGDAIRRSIQAALSEADLEAADLGHVNAHGISMTDADRLEAQAIHGVLGDVPVTAPKSYFGHLGAGSGAVEMIASVLALQQNRVPATLNYEQPDPECPVNVIHEGTLSDAKPAALVLNQASTGQAAALMLAAP